MCAQPTQRDDAGRYKVATMNIIARAEFWAEAEWRSRLNATCAPMNVSREMGRRSSSGTGRRCSRCPCTQRGTFRRASSAPTWTSACQMARQTPISSGAHLLPAPHKALEPCTTPCLPLPCQQGAAELLRLMCSRLQHAVVSICTCIVLHPAAAVDKPELELTGLGPVFLHNCLRCRQGAGGGAAAGGGLLQAGHCAV